MNYLLKSNKGNHTGFQRKWKVLLSDANKDILLGMLEQIALSSSDNYSLCEKTGNVIDDCDNTQYEKGIESFEHDLYYYTIESDDDLEKLEKYSTGHRAGIYSAINNYKEQC